MAVLPEPHPFHELLDIRGALVEAREKLHVLQGSQLAEVYGHLETHADFLVKGRAQSL